MADKYKKAPRKCGDTGLKNRIRMVLKAKKGVTLVELVVTFALISLFATSTCLMLGAAIRVYHQIRGLNNAWQVSDTLLDKVTGELEGARTFGARGGNAKVLKISDGGKVIEFVDRTGSQIAISTTDNGSLISGRESKTYPVNQLLIYYYPVIDTVIVGDGHESSHKRYEAVDWTYDQAAYMGFEIESLTFSWVGRDDSAYPKNVFKVELKLSSGQYGTFTSERYVECYNFQTDTDFSKIESN